MVHSIRSPLLPLNSWLTLADLSSISNLDLNNPILTQAASPSSLLSSALGTHCMFCLDCSSLRAGLDWLLPPIQVSGLLSAPRDAALPACTAGPVQVTVATCYSPSMACTACAFHVSPHFTHAPQGMPISPDSLLNAPRQYLPHGTEAWLHP